MAGYLFFRSSRSTHQQVTELFDFVWPTTAALWNLRWQVAGLSATQTSVTTDMLTGRFIAGSGIHGANLKRACLETTWDQQQSQFAKFLLIDLFALYEGWLARTLSEMGQTKLEKQFQYPTSGNAGLAPALLKLKGSSSTMLSEAFYTKLTAHPKNSVNTLEALLTCYRCFKECRNTIMHNGGIADSKASEAYQSYVDLTAKDLGLAQKPACAPVTNGNTIVLSLHGAVGFSDVILRLIATLDAEFATTSYAESEFHSQWLAKLGRRYTLKTSDTIDREKQIKRLVGKLGLPEPAKTKPLETYLRAKRLVG